MSTGSSSAAGSVPDDMIDKFVLSYLRSRGYARAEDVFRQTLSSAGLDELAHSVSIDCHATMLKQVLHGVLQQQQSPDAYTEAFQALQDWIEGSLDMYRTELHAVLFPIFIHVFLDLVTKGFPYDAAAFMERFKKDFEARHAREIQALQGLHYPEQIDGNTTAKRFRTYKIDVILSAYSHQLLLSFLQESKLYLLLKIINEHVNLSVMHAKPLQGSGGPGSMHQEITGLTTGEIDSVNNQEIEWGALDQIQEVIKDAAIASSSSSATTKPAVSAAAETSSDMLVDDSAVQLKEARLDFSSLPTVTSRIPLPPITAQLKTRIISDLQARNKSPPASDSQPTICCYTFLNSADSVNCLRIARNGDLVAAGYADSSVRIWNLNDCDREPPYRKFIGHAGPVFSLDVSSDSRFCLSSSEDGTVRLWSVPDHLALVSYSGHNYPVWDVKFSPLDFYFVSGSHDRTARLWSTERIFPLRIFAGHISDVDCVAFHPNSNYVLTGSTDKSIRFWDIQTGNCCRILRGHAAPVRCVSISPDGRYACGGDLNGVVRVYDLGSAQLVCEFDGHAESVTSLQWSVDGTQIASGSLDGSVRIWDFATTNTTVTSGRTSTNVQPKHHMFHTKSTPVTSVRYTASNLLLVGGVFRP